MKCCCVGFLVVIVIDLHLCQGKTEVEENAKRGLCKSSHVRPFGEMEDQLFVIRR